MTETNQIYDTVIVGSGPAYAKATAGETSCLNSLMRKL